MPTEKKLVYFAGAIRGDRSVAHLMIEMIEYIKSMGIVVLTEHIANHNPADDLPARDIEVRDIAWLDTATHVIAEISGSSTGTGREIEYARAKGDLGKVPAHVLCLYQKDREFSASPMIRGMDTERYPNVEVRAYADIAEAKSYIKEFLEK